MLGPTDAWIAELRGCGDPQRSAQLVKELKRDIGELTRWMHRAWEWLDRNPTSPVFMDREDRLIVRIGLYVAAVSAVRQEEERAA